MGGGFLDALTFAFRCLFGGGDKEDDELRLLDTHKSTSLKTRRSEAKMSFVATLIVRNRFEGSAIHKEAKSPLFLFARTINRPDEVGHTRTIAIGCKSVEYK